MSLLYIKDLKVSYGGIEAIKGISLSVEKGEIVTLIGANGAGKSTTLRAISGWCPSRTAPSLMTARSSAGKAPRKSFPRASAWCRRGGGCFPT